MRTRHDSLMPGIARASTFVLVAVAIVLVLGRGVAGATAGATVVVNNPGFTTLAVDPAGTAWGYPTAATTQLWKSTDEAKTWSRVSGWDTIGRRPWYITALSTGTLLVHYDTGFNWAIARSDDHGLTWNQVLVLPCIAQNCSTRYSTLTRRSIAEGGGDVYLGTYNTAPGEPWPNYIYRSSDDGRSWTVSNTTTTHRHIHGLTWDPVKQRLYALFGDSAGDGVWYSDDRGVTLRPLCTEYRCIAIQTIDDPAAGAFVVFGTDNAFTTNRIVKVDAATGTATDLFTMTYPSYSSLRVGSVWLVAETHEAGGIFIDPVVHLYASDDGGATWTSVYESTIVSADLAHKMVINGVFPNGDVVIQAAQGTVVLRLGGSPPPPPPPTPPVNTGAPVVTGLSQVGQTLSASNGSWSGSPTGFAYRWRRCDPSGGACGDISGATASSYVVAQSDVGSTLRVRVTASNAAGSGQADSAATPVVAAAPAAPNLAPNGSFEQNPAGAYVTQGKGTFSWATDQSHSPTHALKIVSSKAALSRWLTNTTQIAAQAGTTYTASGWVKTSGVVGGARVAMTFWSASLGSLGVAAESPIVGGSQDWRQVTTSAVPAPAGTAYVRLELRLSGPGTAWFDDVLLTNDSAPPPPPPVVLPPVSTGAPVVTGTAQAGQVLSASAGSWSNSPTAFAYQWRRCDSAGGACADIASATGSTYLVAQGDIGATLRVRVTASNVAGSATADSQATAVVTAAPPSPTNELAPNPDFEQNPAGVYTTNGPATFTWATDQSRSPSHSLKIVSSTSQLVRWMTNTGQIAAQAGKSYSASVWVRTSGLSGNARLVFTFWNASGTYLGVAPDSSPVSGTQDWQRLSRSAVAPSGTASVRIELRQEGIGSTWWDDVSLSTP